MPLENKEIKNIKRMLSILNPDTLTKEDFLEAFKGVMTRQTDYETQNKNDVSEIVSALKAVSDKSKSDNDSNLALLKQDFFKEVDKLLAKFQTKESEITRRMNAIKNGKDADEVKVVEAILKRMKKEIKIPKVEEFQSTIPKLGGKVRDALEKLEGDDRLDVSAIKGIKKLIGKSGLMMGGGTPPTVNAFADDETPVGTVNGTNKVFTITNIPSPASSLKVYVNGQKMTLTEDYTFSGTTITFVTAPPTTSIIRADYRL